MSYPQQAELEKELGGLIDQFAEFLHGKGYYEPAGVDVLVDRTGRHLVVDLNVRVTGSYSMGCLRGHFQGRGLNEALLYSFSARCSQTEFRRHFQEAFEDGTFVLISWTSVFPAT